jgi:hypothetical protein
MRCPRLTCGGTLFEIRNHRDTVNLKWQCLSCNNIFSWDEIVKREHRETIFDLAEVGDGGEPI